MAEKILYIMVSKVKAKLSGNGFQVKKEALQAIDELFGRALENLIQGTVSENVKSIGTDDVYRLLKFEISSPKKKVVVLADEDKAKGCQRCGDIKDEFVQHGRSVQNYCSDQAKILAKKL